MGDGTSFLVILETVIRASSYGVSPRSLYSLTQIQGVLDVQSL